MDVIVVSQRRDRTWRFRLSPSSTRIWVPLSFALLGIVAGAVAGGWWLRTAQGKLPADVVALWTRQVEEQRQELAETRQQAEESSTAVAKRVAELQAHVLRLDAAGERMAKLAGLDPGEFNFKEPPPVGGPEEPDLAPLADNDPVLAALQAFEEKLAARESQMRVLEDLLLTGQQLKQGKGTGRPIAGGYVSSTYGWRADPFTGRRAFHSGIDFAGASRSDVLAVASGIVQEVGPREGYGMLVEINHGNGYVTRYGHNSRILVKVGDKVAKGQRIASMGSTGRSTGPHVHFELLLNGLTVDPARYIAAGQ